MVCDPGIPGPPGGATPPSSPGEEKESQASGKGTLLLRARGGMKVTKNRGGNGNK